MQKVKIFLILFISVFIISCGPTKTVPSDDSVSNDSLKEFKKLDSTISRKIYSTDKLNSSELVLHYEFYPETSYPWQDTINKLVGEFVWFTTRFSNDGFKTQKLTADYFEKQMDSLVFNYETYAQEPFSMLWDYDAHITIDEKLKNFVQLTTTWTSFTGGVHGNILFNTYLVSKKSGELLTFDKLVSDKSKFNEIAESYFRKELKIEIDQDLSELGYWFEDTVFSCNDNFYPEKDGITFFFNVYEIAPYNFGQISFNIPLHKIKDLIKVELE
jgi:hypothetical protein